METATATARAERLLQRRRLSIAGSRVLWLAIGLTAAGAAIRFSTLGLQSYHHDAVVTAARVLPGSFGHMLHEVRHGESTPWLYYVLAWLWSQLFGLHEVGLRSLSALLGAATIPVSYLIGAQLAGRRAGLLTMAIVAVNPMLIWYSQEARTYALMILLCAVSLLFFLRARRSGAGSDLAIWSVSSGLAVASHYFAIFPVAIEAGWLLFERRPRRPVLYAIGGLGLAVAAVAPLALDQGSNATHIDWIAHTSLPARLQDAAASVFVGETGKVIGAAGPREGYAGVPLLIVAAVATLALAAGTPERRGIRVGLIVGLGSVGLALLAALPGKDYILARNLLPALVPLLVAIGVAAASIRYRRLAVTLAAALCLYWVAFDIRVDTVAGLQRPDWRAVADRLGPPKRPRAIVTWILGVGPMQYYLDDRSLRLGKGSGPVRVSEVDVVVKRGAARASDPLAARFRSRAAIPLGRFTILRYRGPEPVTLGLRVLNRSMTGFATNRTIVDGATPTTVGPLPTPRGLPVLSKGPELVAHEVERHRRGHGQGLGLQLRQLGRHQQLQQRKVDAKGRDAHRKEARRLKAGRP